MKNESEDLAGKTQAIARDRGTDPDDDVHGKKGGDDGQTHSIGLRVVQDGAVMRSQIVHHSRR